MIVTLAAAAVLAAALWAFGVLFGLVNAQLVGEILVGLALAPTVAATGLDASLVTTVKVLGEIGLVMLVLEGGLNIQLAQLRSVGLPALLIASVGTLAPCLLGWGFMSVLGCGALEGFAAGTALSSTSIGMATNMLQALELLPTPLGRLICVAAMIDDVLSLVILAVLAEVSGAASGSDDLWWAILKPIVVSIGVIALGVVSALLTPLLFNVLDHPRWLGRCSLATSSEARQRVVLSLLLGLCAALTVGAGYAGSTHILGSFAAGVSFSAVPGVLELWEDSVAPIASWLSTVFFCSIGAAIPLAALVQPEFFLWGAFYTVPAVAGKLFVGLGADLACVCRLSLRRKERELAALPPAGAARRELELASTPTGAAESSGGEGGAELELAAAEPTSEAATRNVTAAACCSVARCSDTPATPAGRFAAARPAASYLLDAQVIGWAMVGRGELGFVMAQQAYDGKLISLRSLTACVWALLIATFISPFAMKAALRCRQCAHRRESSGGDDGAVEEKEEADRIRTE